MPSLLALTAAALLAATGASTTELTIDVERLRNAKGVVHACLTRSSEHFPDCRKDPAALHRTVQADARTIRFDGVAPGSYALTLLHDENGNKRLDTVLGIPREGFGFSRNPPIRMGPPRFEQVVVRLESGTVRQTVRMKYLL